LTLHIDQLGNVDNENENNILENKFSLYIELDDLSSTSITPPVEAAEGRLANGKASNTWKPWLMYLIQFQTFLSSHYHESVLPN
jgi:hypothetical protein